MAQTIETLRIASDVTVDASHQEAIAFPESDPPKIIATSPEIVDGRTTQTWRVFCLMTSPSGYRLCPEPRLDNPAYLEWLEDVGISHEELVEAMGSERAYR